MDKPTREVMIRDRLRDEQTQWLPMFRDVSAFCCPQKQMGINNAMAELNVMTRARFNPVRQSSTAIYSLNVASGGLKSWLTPGGDDGWGGMLEPDPAISKGAAAKDWLADCSQRMLAPMHLGCFFTAAGEMYQDILAFGTTGFLIDDGDQDVPFYCQAIMPTNFVFERDWTGQPIRVIITWSKSASWIKDKFKDAGDVIPEKVKADCAADNGGGQIHELIQSIYLRKSENEQDQQGENEPAGQPYASCWIHVAEKMVMRERGYPEMPFMVPRWNVWAGTGPSSYGTSPAMEALADCKGLNLFDMVMAVRAEIEINPRIKVLPSQTGAIDLSPGGITQANEVNGVTEWAMAGNYPIGKDQVEIITKRIQQSFFVDMFQAITPIAQQREMNIPVAQAVQREAADRISPAMGRMESEFFQQAIRRIFGILRRADYFEAPPPDSIYTDLSGRQYLVQPRIVQANRWTRTINSKKTTAFMSSMGRALQIAQVKPDIFDRYNFPVAVDEMDRDDGLPGAWKFTDEEVQKMQVARAQAAQQQQQNAVLAQAAAGHPLDVARIATGQIAPAA